MAGETVTPQGPASVELSIPSLKSITMGAVVGTAEVPSAGVVELIAGGVQSMPNTADSEKPWSAGESASVAVALTFTFRESMQSTLQVNDVRPVSPEVIGFHEVPPSVE